jgi:nucleotidyltransferase substrate binding protein (TIGR01987 family)
MAEILDLTALDKATASFKVALDEYAKDTSNEFVRDACIQRFEYCYDLAAKMIARYLSMAAANPSEVKEMSFQDKVREAYSQKLLQNSWDVWWVYRDNRNKTSHSYNLSVVLEIMQDIDSFYDEVAYLLHALQTKSKTQGAS